MKIIAFFNCKGGVGTSTLAYHLGWMLADLNCRVVMADLDPQANLTSMFLDDDRLDELWPAGEHPCTIHGLLEPMIRGIRDIGRQIHIEPISGGIGLIVGDLGLSAFDDKLGESRAISGAMSRAASDWDAEYVLVDPGPNPGAITRAALIAADHVIVPVASDLFSLQGLRNLGPRLREWRAGRVPPLGYVITQHAIRQNRPVREYSRWLNRIPGEYRESVLGEAPGAAPAVEQDPHCMASLKQYRSLMPMALDARKPMFHLRPAHGAIGSHVAAVLDCQRDFKRLAERIIRLA